MSNFDRHQTKTLFAGLRSKARFLTFAEADLRQNEDTFIVGLELGQQVADYHSRVPTELVGST